MRRRMLRHPLGSGFDPGAVHAAVVGARGDSFWLDGGADGVSVIGFGVPVTLPAPVLSSLDRILARLAVDAEPELDGFVGGLVGWIGYELRGETIGADVPVGGTSAAFLEVDRMVVIDAASGDAELRALGPAWTGELDDWRDATAAGLEAVRGAQAPPVSDVADAAASGSWRMSDDAYLDAIARCRAAIREGDAYQLCLTNEYVLPRMPGAPRIDAVALHRILRATSPTHHGGLVRIGGTDLVSASPERFLRIRPDGTVESRPIKGTRPRGSDPVADADARAELLGSGKERAENVMIVDLVRNDLSRICDPATVEVAALFEVESYAQVHQLVSTVRGRMRPGTSLGEAIAALFPAGSMTGAPKRRAAELLDAIEQRPRGLYAGAFGWLGADGAVDLAMTIRSIVIDDSGATIGAGGGITALSDPIAELEEVRIKAAPLLRALERTLGEALAGNAGGASGVGYAGPRPSGARPPSDRETT